MNKSVFDLSHERQLTAKADGTLYPILCEAALPGGKYKMNTECLARMTPLINPVYSRFDMYLHYFFVPNRIIWEDWEEFINPSNALAPEDVVFPSVYVAPQASLIDGNNNIAYEDCLAGSLADHLGLQLNPDLPHTESSLREISLLPFRAYQQIWNDHFRDTDLEPEIEFPKTGGFSWHSGQTPELVLRKKAWEKDYFTSARPYPQRGTAMAVPITGSAKIEFQGVAGKEPRLQKLDGTLAASGALSATVLGGGAPKITRAGESTVPLFIVPNESLYADMNQRGTTTLGSQYPETDHSPEFTIESLREANAIQQLLERSLKAGAHYWDMLSTFFGVKTRDSRFQKSEFIGGARQPVTISEVLQTSQSETTPLGTYGGHGISSGSNKIGTFVAPEHGYIIGLLSIMPRAVYLNQIRRDFFKQSRFDFYFPDLANLGEQEVYNAEIRAGLSEATEGATFGYQERWAEHRFIPSTVHGQFRSDAILKNFTAGRAGASNYILDSDFIHVTADDETERIFAIDEYDPFLVNIMSHITAVLPVPRHSNPSLL